MTRSTNVLRDRVIALASAAGLVHDGDTLAPGKTTLRR